MRPCESQGRSGVKGEFEWKAGLVSGVWFAAAANTCEDRLARDDAGRKRNIDRKDAIL